jgi:LmbE family N-acetylglucosaminyl deacetylase
MRPRLARSLALLAALAGAAPASPAEWLAPDAVGVLDAGTRLLVVAPHPDDETLCCGGVIERVARAGGSVSVVWVTSGDASWLTRFITQGPRFATAAGAIDVGLRRMAEARAATAQLGVPQSGQLFLGYPDGGVAALLGAHQESALRSSATGALAVPYRDALFPDHPYTGASLQHDFAAVLERVQPTLILAPSPLDEHPDHRASGLLTLAAVRQPGVTAQVRYWIVHGGEGWPSPRGLLAGVPLTPPPRGRALDARPFVLSAAEEDGKLRALDAYATQMRTLGPFLLAFVRTTELYSVRAQPPPPSPLAQR